MKIDVESYPKCDIGLDCEAGYACDIPSRRCLPENIAMVQIPPDTATRDSWTGPIFAKVEEVITEWKKTRAAYLTMVYTREQWNIPLFSDGWTQSQDAQYWLMNEVVLTLARYASEVDEGVRDVAYDTFGKQTVIAGDLSDMRIRIDGDKLSVKVGSAEGDIEQKSFPKPGTVGSPGIIAAVIVIALLDIVGLVTYCILMHDYFIWITQRDVLKAREAEAKARIAAGEDPAAAYTAATDNTNKTLKAMTEKAKVDAEGGPKGAMETFEKIAWIALGVAVVGVTAYFVAPFIQGALAAKPRPQLAQANPSRDFEQESREREVYRRFLREMQELMWSHGYWRDDAETLQEEGMGPEELRHILQTTTPGEVGSLEYTHRIKRRPDAGTRVGTRVQLHPGTDRWMQGDRYGEIVKDTGSKVMVHLDKSGKKVWFKSTDVMPINENPARSKSKPSRWDVTMQRVQQALEEGHILSSYGGAGWNTRQTVGPWQEASDRGYHFVIYSEPNMANQIELRTAYDAATYFIDRVGTSRANEVAKKALTGRIDPGHIVEI